MNPLESIVLALRGLAAHRLRSSLTMLGLIIGVSAVVVLLSLGRGVQEQIISQVKGIGTNLLFVMPGRSMQGGMRGAMGSVYTLTLEDAEAISSASLPSVAAVAPNITTYVEVVVGRESVVTEVAGTTPNYRELYNYTLAAGESFTQRHMEGRARVIVLGNSVAKTLFGEANPVGQYARINGIKYRVLGVMDKKGTMFMINMDDFVIMPLTTVLAKFTPQRTTGGGHSVTSILVKARSPGEIGSAGEQVSELLRKRHRLAADEENDFNISTVEDLLDILGMITGVLTIFLAAVAGISLLVGGVGIMNIMLVSVTERTREIGIRKAVGAKQRDILGQFLIESAALSFSGGGIGLLVGWGIAQGISAADFGGQTIRAIVSPDIVLLAFSVAVAIGVFFGFYPAYRAARLNPIDALRYE